MRQRSLQKGLQRKRSVTARAALSFALTYLLVWGSVPTQALAEMTDEASPSIQVVDQEDPLVLDAEDVVLIEVQGESGEALNPESIDPEDQPIEVQSDVQRSISGADGTYANKDGVYSYTLNVDSNAIIINFAGKEPNLVIPPAFGKHTVVGIGNFNNRGAFQDNTTLESVTIPNTVAEIGANAFKGCAHLETVELPTGLKRIYDSAFANCTNIQSIVIPEGTTMVGNSAFASCALLAQVSLPTTITQIGKSAFSGCTALTSILIPEAVTSIGDSAFASCSALMSVSFFTPNSTKVPSIRTMGSSVFSGCTGITSIVVPASLVSCGTSRGPFVGCTNLKEVSFEEGTTRVASGLLADCPGIESIEIPTGIVGIGDSAFKNCFALSQVSLPAGLETIGASAFYSCAQLPRITFPRSVTSIGNNAFMDCSRLTGIYLPVSLTTIGSSAFKNCGWMWYVVMYDNLTSIGSNAFENTDIDSLRVPSSVTQIGSSAFANCSSLAKVEFVNAEEGSDAKTSVGSSAFAGCTWLKTVILSNAVTAISASTFSGCERLENVTLPETLLSIGDSAFRNCDSLKGLEVPPNVKTLGREVFYDCDDLAWITMPKSVTSLGKSIFYDCDALVDVSLGAGLLAIPQNAFQHCDALAELAIPRSVTKIDEDAFIECTMLASVHITPATMSIAASAFSYPKKVTIYGVAGSYAEEYANARGIKFQAEDVKVTSIVITPPAATLRKGERLQMLAEIEPANYTGTVSWESSNPLVATISETGLIDTKDAALEPNTRESVNITIRVGSQSWSIPITVIQGVSSLSLSPTSLKLEGGQAQRIAATVKPDNADNKQLDWSSSDDSVAIVDATGKVRGLKTGTATITCATTDGTQKKATSRVTVTSDATVATNVSQLESTHPYADGTTASWLYTKAGATALSVTFDAQTSLAADGDRITLFDGDDNEVGTFIGTDLAGKTVDVPGDTVRIRLSANAADSAWGFKVSKVVQAGAVNSVVLSESELLLVTGTTHALVATCSPADAASRVVWKSGNEKVATVSAQGVVSVLTAGTATITASVGQKSDSCVITAVAPISMSSTSVASIPSYYYQGVPIEPKPVVTYKGETLVEGVDYEVEYQNQNKVGRASIILRGMGFYTGTKTVTFSILEKKTNTLSARVIARSVSCAFSASNPTVLESNITVSAPVGAVSYQNASADVTASGFGVNSTTGGVTVPKGTMPGTYTLMVQVNAAGDDTYKDKSVVVTYTIVVAKMANTVAGVANKETVSCTYSPSSVASIASNVTVTGAQGTVAFTNASTDSTAKRFVVEASTGKVSVPQNTTAGTYTMIVKVTAGGNAYYEAGSVLVAYNVLVKRRTNPLTAKASLAAVSCPFSATNASVLPSNIVVSGAQGALTYTNVSVNATAKKFVVDSKSGKVSIPGGVKAGTYTTKISVRAAGNTNYKARTIKVVYKITITKLANPMVVRTSAATVSAASVKTKAQTVAPITVSNAKGKVTYKMVVGSACLTVLAKTGKTVVKKGTKSGTYTASVQVSAAGTGGYNPLTQTVNVVVYVR